MSKLTTSTGDTFALLARRAFGDEQKAGLIKSANPGLTEPFGAGVTITVPSAPVAPTASQTDDPDELVVEINGARFRYWTAVSLNRSIDAMDTLVVSAPFEPDDAAFRAAFRPFAFAPVGISVGGAPLFTGTMITPDPTVGEAQRVVSADCYSTPAVLADCTAPASMYPIEWDEADLRQIAATLLAPFGLSAQFDAPPGAVFQRVSLNTGEKILAFLIKLAQQRGLLVSSTPDGKLRFAKSTPAGNPVAHLKEGEAPLRGITPTFNAREYYSAITAIEPMVVGLGGEQVTVQNSSLKGTVRPFAFEVQDTADADVQAACEAKVGRMFANAVTYSISVATWRDPQGELWGPNTTILVTAPGVMIYSAYEFLIRAVAFTRAADGGTTATLTVTVPGAFDGTLPESLPWD